jgi:Glycosyltransferase
MKFLFDARFIRTDHHDGVSLYSTSLARAVFNQKQDVVFLIFKDEQIKFLPDGAKIAKISSPESIKGVLFSRAEIARLKPDIVYSPMQTTPNSRRYKLILTLHDMTYYKFNVPPKNHPWFVRMGWKLFYMAYWPQRIVLNKADTVTTVSETSKAEILDARLTKRPVVVVSNAARSLSDFHERPKQNTNPPKNLIFIGTGQPHKNIETLIKGTAFLPNRVLHLLSPMSKEMKRYYNSLCPDGVDLVYHDGFDSEKEAKIFFDDAILVSASKAEGFGLPLVEAMDYHIPIVVSDIPIFHEVAGKSAKFFDPDDPSDFARTVMELDDKKTRDIMIREGITKAKDFDWDKSARTLIDVVEKLINEEE